MSKSPRSFGEYDRFAREGALYRHGGSRRLASPSNAVEYHAQHAPSIVAEFADAIERGVKDVTVSISMSGDREERGAPQLCSAFPLLHFFAVESGEIVILHIRHAAQWLPWEGGRRQLAVSEASKDS